MVGDHRGLKTFYLMLMDNKSSVNLLSHISGDLFPRFVLDC